MSNVVNVDWKQWLHLSPTGNRSSIRAKGLIPKARVITRPKKIWLTQPFWIRKVFYHLIGHHGLKVFDVWIVYLPPDREVRQYNRWAWRTTMPIASRCLTLAGMLDPGQDSYVIVSP